MTKSSKVNIRQRWRFVKDDDGHDYLIHAEDLSLFESMLADKSDEYNDKFSERFGEFSTGGWIGSYTFLDPREDE